MKVICIKYATKVAEDFTHTLRPIVGEYYTVIDTVNAYGNYYYEIQEFPTTARYRVDLFAPTSEIDETTFERNYKKELV